MSNSFIQGVTSFSMLEISIIVVCALLFVLSPWIARQLNKRWSDVTPQRQNSRISIYRASNLLVIVLVFFNHFFWTTNPQGASKILACTMVFYATYLVVNISNYLILGRMGKRREINQLMQVSETYHSRLISLLAAIFFITIAVLTIVQILGFNSLLEAGGVLGFIGIMLGLTQSAWAPDIISGLIILNTGLVDEGDVVEIKEENLYGVVFRTKLFHTEILNIVNNHRIIIANSRVRALMLHNLSKFASARGLRENLSFNIGYDVTAEEVHACFLAAYEQAKLEKISFEGQHDLEVRVLATGDDAVEWGFYYYTKKVQELIATRQNFLRIILQQSQKRGIALSTPRLLQVDGAVVNNQENLTVETPKS